MFFLDRLQMLGIPSCQLEASDEKPFDWIDLSFYFGKR
jgi:hypothetical protein